MWDVLQFLVILLPTVGLAGGAVLLEYTFPRRPEHKADGLRWVTGVALTFTGLTLVQLLAPFTSIFLANLAQVSGFGLLNMVDLPLWMVLVVGFLAYDLANWLFHWTAHKVPALWRLHRVHHSDREVDASTSLKFHPFEIVVGSVVLGIVTVLMGLPMQAIFVHFVLMQVFTFWHHANIRPFPYQDKLSLLFNTPELHRVHHGAKYEHNNSNFGTVTSIWDRLFGTLNHAPDAEITFGLNPNYWDNPDTLGSLLIDPTRR